MQEGLSLNLMLNGATLLSVLGLGVKVYLAGKAQKIEQPLEIRAADSSTPIKQCDERHDEINSWRDNMYSRVIRLENSQAAYEATQEGMKTQLSSMDGKLDKLIARGK